MTVFKAIVQGLTFKIVAQKISYLISDTEILQNNFIAKTA